MRIAAVLHGNLRTFFMPLRENVHLRICDLLYSNVIEHNSIDVFLVTDTDDFFYNGIQYFDETQRTDKTLGFGRELEVVSSMFYDDIDFMKNSDSARLLSSELSSFFGSHLKGMRVDVLNAIEGDPKLSIFNGDKSGGCMPERLVRQYLKIKAGYELLVEYERANGIHYDIIFRGRLDNKYGEEPLDILSYNYVEHDLFCPGIINSDLVYDWCAFGKRWAMDHCLNLYDRLGFTLDNRVSHGDGEITASSEHHLSRLFKEMSIKCASSKYQMAPYRYR